MVLKVSSVSAILDDNPFYGDLTIDPSTTTGLTFGYTSGKNVVDGANVPIDIPAGTVSLTDDSDNTVYDDLGTIDVAVSDAEPSGVRRLYKVTTASGVITTIIDLRGAFN